MKLNWMGPTATMSVQRKAEAYDSRRTAMEEASGATLDCRKLIQFQGRSAAAAALASLFFLGTEMGEAEKSRHERAGGRRRVMQS